jgi:hypothetical protein
MDALIPAITRARRLVLVATIVLAFLGTAVPLITLLAGEGKFYLFVRSFQVFGGIAIGCLLMAGFFSRSLTATCERRGG